MDRSNAYEYFYRLQLNSNSQLDGVISINNITAYDKAGNLANPSLYIDNSRVRIDNVKPIYNIQYPTDSIYVNTLRVYLRDIFFFRFCLMAAPK